MNIHDTMRYEWNINELSIIGRFYSEGVSAIYIINYYGHVSSQIPDTLLYQIEFIACNSSHYMHTYSKYWRPQNAEYRIKRTCIIITDNVIIFEYILSNSVNQKFIVMEKIKCNYFAIYVLFVFTILKIIIMWAM